MKTTQLLLWLLFAVCASGGIAEERAVDADDYSRAIEEYEACFDRIILGGKLRLSPDISLRIFASVWGDSCSERGVVASLRGEQLSEVRVVRLSGQPLLEQLHELHSEEPSIEAEEACDDLPIIEYQPTSEQLSRLRAHLEGLRTRRFFVTPASEAVIHGEQYRLMVEATDWRLDLSFKEVTAGVPRHAIADWIDLILEAAGVPCGLDE